MERQDVQPDGNPDRKQLTQEIIDEMNAQGFLEDFIDKETGEALLEIQYADRSMVCKIDTGKTAR